MKRDVMNFFAELSERNMRYTRDASPKQALPRTKYHGIVIVAVSGGCSHTHDPGAEWEDRAGARPSIASSLNYKDSCFCCKQQLYLQDIEERSRSWWNCWWPYGEAQNINSIFHCLLIYNVETLLTYRIIEDLMMLMFLTKPCQLQLQHLTYSPRRRI